MAKQGPALLEDRLWRAIRACPLFGPARAGLLDLIADRSIERHLAPHRSFVLQGERFPYLGIVCEGSVEAILCSPEGREQVLYEAAPSETFAEIPMLDGEETLSRFVAGKRGAVAVLVPTATLEAACAKDSALGMRVARAAAHRAREMTTYFEQLAFSTTLARAAKAIDGMLAERREGWLDAPASLAATSQSELAERIGTVRVVAARALRTLAREGAIVLERGRVRKVNYERLSRRL